MKKIFFLSIICFGFILPTEAQTKKTKGQAAKKGVVKKSTSMPKMDTGTVVLGSASSNAAYGPTSSSRLTIADPTINYLQLRAAGAEVATGRNPILGMPRSTYGIADGRILLRNTTATTSGTAFGSGAVATGTSLLGAGTSESVMGVNGKSPYAGTWLWGDRRPVYTVPIGDSTRRQ